MYPAMILDHIFILCVLKKVVSTGEKEKLDRKDNRMTEVLDTATVADNEFCKGTYRFPARINFLKLWFLGKTSR